MNVKKVFFERPAHNFKAIDGIRAIAVLWVIILQVIQWHKTLINITGLFILLLFAIYYLFVKFDSI